MKKTLPLIFLVFSTLLAFAQKANESYRYHIKKAVSPLVIDGVMDEEAWLQAESAKTFI